MQKEGKNGLVEIPGANGCRGVARKDKGPSCG
jgi:hypothetical protein